MVTAFVEIPAAINAFATLWTWSMLDIKIKVDLLSSAWVWYCPKIAELNESVLASCSNSAMSTFSSSCEGSIWGRMRLIGGGTSHLRSSPFNPLGLSDACSASQLHCVSGASLKRSQIPLSQKDVTLTYERAGDHR